MALILVLAVSFSVSVALAYGVSVAMPRRQLLAYSVRAALGSIAGALSFSVLAPVLAGGGGGHPLAATLVVGGMLLGLSLALFAGWTPLRGFSAEWHREAG